MNGAVGFTAKGKVSLTFLSTADGKPLATTIEMSPSSAKELAINLNASALRAEVINVRDGANPH